MAKIEQTSYRTVSFTRDEILEIIRHHMKSSSEFSVFADAPSYINTPYLGDANGKDGMSIDFRVGDNKADMRVFISK